MCRSVTFAVMPNGCCWDDATVGLAHWTPSNAAAAQSEIARPAPAVPTPNRPAARHLFDLLTKARNAIADRAGDALRSRFVPLWTHPGPLSLE